MKPSDLYPQPQEPRPDLQGGHPAPEEGTIPAPPEVQNAPIPDPIGPDVTTEALGVAMNLYDTLREMPGVIIPPSIREILPRVEEKMKEQVQQDTPPPGPELRRPTYAEWKDLPADLSSVVSMTVGPDGWRDALHEVYRGSRGLTRALFEPLFGEVGEDQTEFNLYNESRKRAYRKVRESDIGLQLLRDVATGFRSSMVAVGAGAAVGATTLNPTAALTTTLGVLGGQVFGNKYEDLRMEGFTPEESAGWATGHALAEIVPELAFGPSAKMLRAGRMLPSIRRIIPAAAKRQALSHTVLDVALSEFAQEGTTGFLQHMQDWAAGLKPEDYSIAQLGRQALYEGLIGMASAPLTSTVVGAGSGTAVKFLHPDFYVTTQRYNAIRDMFPAFLREHTLSMLGTELIYNKPNMSQREFVAAMRNIRDNQEQALSENEDGARPEHQLARKENKMSDDRIARLYGEVQRSRRLDPGENQLAAYEAWTSGLISTGTYKSVLDVLASDPMLDARTVIEIVDGIKVDEGAPVAGEYIGPNESDTAKAVIKLYVGRAHAQADTVIHEWHHDLWENLDAEQQKVYEDWYETLPADMQDPGGVQEHFANMGMAHVLTGYSGLAPEGVDNLFRGAENALKSAVRYTQQFADANIPEEIISLFGKPKQAPNRLLGIGQLTTGRVEAEQAASEQNDAVDQVENLEGGFELQNLPNMPLDVGTDPEVDASVREQTRNSRRARLYQQREGLNFTLKSLIEDSNISDYRKQCIITNIEEALRPGLVRCENILERAVGEGQIGQKSADRILEAIRASVALRDLDLGVNPTKNAAWINRNLPERPMESMRNWFQDQFSRLSLPLDMFILGEGRPTWDSEEQSIRELRASRGEDPLDYIARVYSKEDIAKNMSLNKTQFRRLRRALYSGRFRKVEGDPIKWVGETVSDPKWDKPLYQARAWHGTPHRFDQFSTDFMGSGEGVQAYGWGLYYTDTEGIARDYKEKLSLPEKVVTFSESDEEFIRSNDGWGLDSDSPDHIAAEMLSQKDERGSVLGEEWLRQIAEAEEEGDSHVYLEHVGEYPLDRVREALNIIEEGGIHYEERRGTLYEVDLAPQEDEYLLWDKPLSEQSQKVKEALLPLFQNLEIPTGTDKGEYSGARLYEELVKHFEQKWEDPSENPSKAASQMLLSAGIRGNKFLDGTSRKKGAGSYNYVIFSDSDVEIKGRYQRRIEAERDTEELLKEAEDKGLHLATRYAVEEFLKNPTRGNLTGVQAHLHKDFNKNVPEKVKQNLIAQLGKFESLARLGTSDFSPYPVLDDEGYAFSIGLPNRNLDSRIEANLGAAFTRAFGGTEDGEIRVQVDAIYREEPELEERAPVIEVFDESGQSEWVCQECGYRDYGDLSAEPYCPSCFASEATGDESISARYNSEMWEDLQEGYEDFRPDHAYMVSYNMEEGIGGQSGEDVAFLTMKEARRVRDALTGKGHFEYGPPKDGFKTNAEFEAWLNKVKAGTWFQKRDPRYPWRKGKARGPYPINELKMPEWIVGVKDMQDMAATMDKVHEKEMQRTIADLENKIGKAAALAEAAPTETEKQYWENRQAQMEMRLKRQNTFRRPRSRAEAAAQCDALAREVGVSEAEMRRRLDSEGLDEYAAMFFRQKLSHMNELVADAADRARKSGLPEDKAAVKVFFHQAVALHDLFRKEKTKLGRGLNALKETAVRLSPEERQRLMGSVMVQQGIDPSTHQADIDLMGEPIEQSPATLEAKFKGAREQSKSMDVRVGETLDDEFIDDAVEELIVSGQNPLELDSKVKALTRGAVSSRAHFWFINSILSGPATWAADFAGQALTMTLAPFENALGAAFGARTAKETVAYSAGMLSAIPEAVKTFFWMHGVDEPSDVFLVNRWYNVLARGHKRATEARSSRKEDKIPVDMGGPSLTGLVGTSLRQLMATATSFKTLVWRAKLHELALKRAGELADTYPDMDRTREETIQYFYKNLLDNPPEDLIAKADDEADYRVFEEKPAAGSFTKKVLAVRNMTLRDMLMKPQKFLNPALSKKLITSLDYARAVVPEQVWDPKAGKFVRNKDYSSLDRLHALLDAQPLTYFLPFVTTPANIARYTVLERTPLGLIPAAYKLHLKKKLKGRRTTAEMQAYLASTGDDIAKSMIGSLLMMLGVYLHQSGYATGPGPSKIGERRAWQDAGLQPYAFNLPGMGNVSVQYNRLEPVGTLIGLGAALNRMWEDSNYNAKTGETRQGFERALDMARGSWEAVRDASLSKTYAQGVLEFAKLFDRHASGKQAERFFGRMVSGFYPNILASAHRAQDGYQRSTEGFFDYLLERYDPAQLPARIDVWGDEISRDGLPVVNWVLPARVTRIRRDDELRRQAAACGWNVPAPVTHLGAYRMTGEEAVAFNKDVGKLAKKTALRMIKNWTDSTPSEVKVKTFKMILDKSRDAVRGRSKWKALYKERPKAAPGGWNRMLLR